MSFVQVKSDLADQRKRWSAFFITLALLGGCESTTGPGPLTLNASQPALPLMQSIVASAQTCWFGPGQSRFSAYRMANETDSYSGRPRILLVPRNNPEGRPLLVVEATGDPARLSAFGPLLSGPEGNRIAADVRRWSSGNTGCS